jgi:hypothetical protein
MRLLQIPDLVSQAVLMLQKAVIPLEIILGEAPIELIEDDFGFWVHDP